MREILLNFGLGQITLFVIVSSIIVGYSFDKIVLRIKEYMLKKGKIRGYNHDSMIFIFILIWIITLSIYLLWNLKL